jgi:hypothetical protein
MPLQFYKVHYESNKSHLAVVVYTSQFSTNIRYATPTEHPCSNASARVSLPGREVLFKRWPVASAMGSRLTHAL